jgi:tetratricopeptide (TPR) repeat protein
VLYDQGEVSGALDSGRAALAIYRKIFPEGHPEYAATLTGMGAWLLETGEFEEAEAMMTDGLAMRRALLGNDHPDIANSLVQLGMVAVATGDHERALALSREAERILDASLPPDHWRSAVARSVEGASLSGLGRFDEAETLLLDGFGVLSRDSGALRVYVRESQRYLEQLYTTWGRPDDAARYAATSLSAREP